MFWFQRLMIVEWTDILVYFSFGILASGSRRDVARRWRGSLNPPHYGLVPYTMVDLQKNVGFAKNPISDHSNRHQELWSIGKRGHNSRIVLPLNLTLHVDSTI